jgi:hypothetical protein
MKFLPKMSAKAIPGVAILKLRSPKKYNGPPKVLPKITCKIPIAEKKINE